ncbi:hypothetical protein ACFO25_01675 [Paenactinomyces guangxiensis]|uniref:Uncharacterized protein n=1 Tax=Paenactinomyces guangxiensis TaxID=1490290 RepID=A0A7W1WS35_9BACL|nr:hypothetical protein [Paenactinomyces guangxiensis]MBA4494939.1 hypothetical protein [Paenactinomyces guangxiensis]MBH8592022.1 hypothetical protein [Paenactinomyces guangxiensis]
MIDHNPKKNITITGGFKNNQGQINIGSDVTNISNTNTQLLLELKKLKILLEKTHDLPEDLKQECLQTIPLIEQEVKQPQPNQSQLEVWRQKLQKNQTLFSAWQTLASTVSMICDLMKPS